MITQVTTLFNNEEVHFSYLMLNDVMNTASIALLSWVIEVTLSNSIMKKYILVI